MHRFLLWQIVKFPFMKIDWYDATLRRPSAFYDPLIHYNFKQRALSKYLVSCLFAAEGEEESKLFFKIIFFSNQQIWELFIIQWVRFLGCAVGACWWSLVLAAPSLARSLLPPPCHRLSSSRGAGDQLPEPWRRRRPEANTTSSRRHWSIRGGQVCLSTSFTFLHFFSFYRCLPLFAWDLLVKPVKVKMYNYFFRRPQTSL